MDVINQHYVPRVYLRRFADQQEKLWAYDKVERKKFNPKVMQVAAERYFYDSDELKQLTGDKQFIEKHLSNLEGEYGQVVASLLASFEGKHYRGISKAHRHFLSAYMTVQLLRTREQRTETQQIVEFTNAMRRKWEKQSGSNPQGLHIFGEEKSEEIARRLQNRSLLDGSMIREMAGVLYRHVWVVKKCFANEPFFTSDAPFAKHPHLKHPIRSLSGIASEGIEIMFPLSSRYSLSLYDRIHFANLAPYEADIQPLTCSENMVYYNQFQVKHSNRFVFSERDDFALVESILDEQPLFGNPSRARFATNHDHEFGRASGVHSSE